jgi:ATP-dependent Clp protease ATP-binding subunit ClpC
LGIFRLGWGIAFEVLARLRLNPEGFGKNLEELAGRGDGTSEGMAHSDALKRALVRAATESARLRHSYIGTEHLLLGLIEGDSDDHVVHMFKVHGIDIEILRCEVRMALSHPELSASATSNKGNCLT